MNKRFYSMEKTGNALDLYVFGDITSHQFFENDVTEHSVVEQIAKADVDKINVHISSYGGEVKTGVAIYNTLKSHKAKVTTYCDGFACSIASVIFMAGDERIMNEASALMMHDVWQETAGNAEQLRKIADDLDKINQLSLTAYKAHSSLSEEDIKALMDKETWILPEEALEYGFATSIEKSEKKNASQNAKMQLLEIIKQYQQEADTQDADEGEKDEPETDEDTQTDTEDATTDEGNADDGETDDGENPDDTADEPTDDEEDGKDEEKTSQKITKFFNAILNM